MLIKIGICDDEELFCRELESKIKYILREQNCEICVANSGEDMLQQVLEADETKQGFDIVFLDPPYCLGISNKVLENISDHLHHGSTVVVETEKNEELNGDYQNIEKAKEYFYGKKKITVYKCSKL